MQAAGARRLQRARRGQQVSSAHASPRAPPSHFRLRSIGTDPTDCLLLSGALRTTPFDFSRLLGAVSGRGGLQHVEGCSVWARGGVFGCARPAGGLGGPGVTVLTAPRCCFYHFFCITCSASPAARNRNRLRHCTA